MLNQKVLVVLIIPLLLIPLASFGYAHFTYTVEKKYKIHVYCGEVDIESYKIYSHIDDNYVADQLINGTLFFSADVYEGWFVWVGLVIKNNGLFDMNYEQTNLEIETIPSDSVTWQSKEFLYGPFTEADFNHNPDVWRYVTSSSWEEKLDPEEGIIGLTPTPSPVIVEGPPAHFNPCKLIAWIYIEIVDGPETFTIEVSVDLGVTIAEPYTEEEQAIMP
ncbi:MAG: hypothetical protein OEX09_06785 [Candidatus Bathyarchaeota archaeon]|nr:hypothetical protein [Candidatus Bathyarchaeota archaeon]MDH5734134.1 hypothetical protein [Candidatus Bathyarchaeota archaeon]